MKDLERFIETKSLALDHSKLMEEKEQLPPGAEISPAKKKEIERLEKKLRKRLYKSLNSDVLPVFKTAITKKDLEFIDHQEILRRQMKGDLSSKIIFRFDVFSSMNTRVDRFKIEALTKKEAWKEAEKRAEKYPGKTKLKIS